MQIRDRTITIVHKKGTVLNIFLNPPGQDRAQTQKRVISAFPNACVRTDSRIKARISGDLRGKFRNPGIKYDLSNLTPFQRRVLIKTAAIPRGECVSYSVLARRLGNPGFSRAVGSALAANPIPIIIPCHRVVRKDGKAGGFMRKKEDKTGWKRFLLDLES